MAQTAELLEDLLEETRRAASEQRGAGSGNLEALMKEERDFAHLLAIERDECQERADTAEEKLRAVTGERNSLRAALNESEAQCQTVSGELSDARAELTDRNNKLSQLEHANASLHKEMEALESELRQQREESAALRVSVAQHEVASKQLQEQVFELTVAGPDTRRELQTVPTVECESQWSAALADLEASAIRALADRDDAWRQVEVAQVEVLRATRATEEVRRELDAMRADRDALARDLQHLRMSDDPSGSEVSVERRRTSEAERLAVANERQYLRTLADYEGALAQLQEKALECETLRGSLAQAEAARDALRRAEVAARPTDVHAFLAAQDTYLKAVAEAHALAAQAEGHTRKALEECATFAAQLSHCQADLDASTGRESTLQTDVSKLNALCDERLSRVADLESQLHTRTEEAAHSAAAVAELRAQHDNLTYIAEKSMLTATEAREEQLEASLELLVLQSVMAKSIAALQLSAPSAWALKQALSPSTEALSAGELRTATHRDIEFVVAHSVMTARIHEALLSSEARRDAAETGLGRWNALFGPTAEAAVARRFDEESFSRAEAVCARDQSHAIKFAEEAELRSRLTASLAECEAELAAARQHLSSVAPRQGDFFVQQRAVMLKHLVQTIRLLKGPKALLEGALHGNPGSPICLASRDDSDIVSDSVADIASIRRAADRLVMRCFTVHERNEFSIIDGNPELEYTHMNRSSGGSVTGGGFRSPSAVNSLYSRADSVERSGGR